MSKPATAGNLGFSEATGLDQLQERPFGRRVYLCEGQVGEERRGARGSAVGETKWLKPAL